MELDGKHARIGTKMPLFHRLFIHISYQLAISVHSQFVFKMPSPTNGSLEWFNYPPVQDPEGMLVEP